MYIKFFQIFIIFQFSVIALVRSSSELFIVTSPIERIGSSIKPAVFYSGNLKDVIRVRWFKDSKKIISCQKYPPWSIGKAVVKGFEIDVTTETCLSPTFRNVSQSFTGVYTLKIIYSNHTAQGSFKITIDDFRAELHLSRRNIDVHDMLFLTCRLTPKTEAKFRSTMNFYANEDLLTDYTVIEQKPDVLYIDANASALMTQSPVAKYKIRCVIEVRQLVFRSPAITLTVHSATTEHFVEGSGSKLEITPFLVPLLLLFLFIILKI